MQFYVFIFRLYFLKSLIFTFFNNFRYNFNYLYFCIFSIVTSPTFIAFFMMKSVFNYCFYAISTILYYSFCGISYIYRFFPNISNVLYFLLRYLSFVIVSISLSFDSYCFYRIIFHLWSFYENSFRFYLALCYFGATQNGSCATTTRTAARLRLRMAEEEPFE